MLSLLRPFHLPSSLLPSAFCFPPSAFCLLLSAYCFLPTAFCLLLSAFCLLLSAYCLLPTAFCLLLSAYCLLPTAFCFLLTAFCLLPPAYCLLLTAYCLLSFSSRGSVIVTFVPVPTLLFTFNWPPWASMIRWAMGSPNPTPFSFVV